MQGLIIRSSGKQGDALSTLEFLTGRFQRRVFRKQLISSDAQDPGEIEQFAIGDPAALKFEAGDGVPADIPAAQLHLNGKLFLGPALLHSQASNLRPYKV